VGIELGDAGGTSDRTLHGILQHAKLCPGSVAVAVIQRTGWSFRAVGGDFAFPWTMLNVVRIVSKRADASRTGDRQQGCGSRSRSTATQSMQSSIALVLFWCRWCYAVYRYMRGRRSRRRSTGVQECAEVSSVVRTSTVHARLAVKRLRREEVGGDFSRSSR